jgi:hypothetical protein
MKAFASCLFLCLILQACTFVPKQEQLVGRWYRGDGTGYNIHLILKGNLTYSAEWTGCLGTYGKAHGKWALDKGVISFTPAEETDMMKGHLKSLEVIREAHDIVLVPPEERESYKTSLTTNTYCCYRRQ